MELFPQPFKFGNRYGSRVLSIIFLHVRTILVKLYGRLVGVKVILKITFYGRDIDM